MKTVVVLAGGNSYEHEISMLSAELIMQSLDRHKYNIKLIVIPKEYNTLWVNELLDNPPDVVLSALHGGLGENGSVQGLLECLDIPYVGSKVLSSAVSMDKNMSKQIMRYNSIPCVDDLFMKRNEDIDIYSAKIYELGFPLIVKPNSGGSSIGITIVNNHDELRTAVDVAKEYDDDILIEKYIPGREITCGLVESKDGLEVLTVLDIDTDNRFYDYQAKYTEHISKIEMSTLPEFMLTMIREIAKKVFIVLDCKGYGRVDMIVKDEQVYVIEMNTLPGLTPHSLIPKAAAKGGVPFGRFLDKIIEFETKD